MRKPSGSYKTHRTTSLQTVTNHARCNIPDNRQIVLRADSIPKQRADPMAPMTVKQLDVVRHSIGMDHDGRRRGDRNHFVTDPDSQDGQTCCELVDLGLMVDLGPHAIAGGMHLYRVTEAGIQASTSRRHKKPSS